MLRLYSEEDIARLRLIKHLVGELGLNVAGVQLVLGLFNRMLEAKAGVAEVDDARLRKYVDEVLDDLFEALHVQLR